MKDFRTKIVKKINSQKGASLMLALLFFVICAAVGLIILVAATSSVGRIADPDNSNSTNQSSGNGIKEVKTVTSAADLFTDRTAGLDAFYKYGSNNYFSGLSTTSIADDKLKIKYSNGNLKYLTDSDDDGIYELSDSDSGALTLGTLFGSSNLSYGTSIDNKIEGKSKITFTSAAVYDSSNTDDSTEGKVSETVVSDDSSTGSSSSASGSDKFLDGNADLSKFSVTSASPLNIRDVEQSMIYKYIGDNWDDILSQAKGDSSSSSTGTYKKYYQSMKINPTNGQLDNAALEIVLKANNDLSDCSISGYIFPLTNGGAFDSSSYDKAAQKMRVKASGHGEVRYSTSTQTENVTVRIESKSKNGDEEDSTYVDELHTYKLVTQKLVLDLQFDGNTETSTNKSFDDDN